MITVLQFSESRGTQGIDRLAALEQNVALVSTYSFTYVRQLNKNFLSERTVIASNKMCVSKSFQSNLNLRTRVFLEYSQTLLISDSILLSSIFYKKSAQQMKNYLIPIKICAPLIFVHQACAKIKGSKFTQYQCSKIKRRRKMPRMNEKTTNLQ